MTEDNHSLDENNGIRGGYPHGTIGANKASARKEFDEMIRDRHANKCSNDILFALHVLEAFNNARLLTTMSQTANADNVNIESWKQFIAIYVRLEENITRADELLMGSKMRRLKKWPRNPDIKFGPDAGWCAWNVAYKFSHRILSAVLVARTMALGVQFHNQFDYLVIDDPSVGKWVNAFIEELGTRTLPRSAEWPVWQINRDAESVRNQLEVEIELVRIGLSDRRKAVQQAAKKEKSQPANKITLNLTDTESNILEALGDSTLHGPALLEKAGYDNSSHYRAILSGLVKRNILDRNACGYHRKSALRQ
jgi:hypothetical protein